MDNIKEREQAFFLVFESLFDKEKDQDKLAIFNDNVDEAGEYAKSLFNGVEENKEYLDSIISKYSTNWKIERLPKTTIAILRIAIYEIKFVDTIPNSIVINEAIELSKKYAGKNDYAFINGILGSYVRGK